MTDSNLGIRVGAAGNQAASVLQGAIAAGKTFDEVVKMHGDLTAAFFENLDTLQVALGSAASATALVANAFPGTTTVPAAAVAPVAPAPATPAPAAIPGAADGDPQVAALWQEFFADPSRFWDNRGSKRNPKAPDFKNKDNGDKALWLQDKKNPSWVGQQLAAAGMAG